MCHNLSCHWLIWHSKSRPAPQISITQCMNCSVLGILLDRRDRFLKRNSRLFAQSFFSSTFYVLFVSRIITIIPESLISSSEATLTLISWLSKLFFAMGLPSLGFSGPGRSVAAAAPTGPSWQKVAGKLGWTWVWDWEDGLGLNASSALGSSFMWKGDLRVSLWLAAADRNKRNLRQRMQGEANDWLWPNKWGSQWKQEAMWRLFLIQHLSVRQQKVSKMCMHLRATYCILCTFLSFGLRWASNLNLIWR